MKILSENPLLLNDIHKELKLARIKVQKETKTVDGAMADEVTIALEILHQVKGHYTDIIFIVGGIRELGKYLTSTIRIEKKDGTCISYEKYESMSTEEKQEIFRA